MTIPLNEITIDHKNVLIAPEFDTYFGSDDWLYR